jgi:hypothetical protein
MEDATDQRHCRCNINETLAVARLVLTVRQVQAQKVLIAILELNGTQLFDLLPTSREK